MNKRRSILNTFVSLGLMLVFVTLAQAQSHQTFVSADNQASDLNPCTLAP
jgi:hypothetical protein